MTESPAGAAAIVPTTTITFDNELHNNTPNDTNDVAIIPNAPKIPPVALHPTKKSKHGHKPKAVRVFCSIFRSFPIFNATCTFNGNVHRMDGNDHISGARRMTGTLFGHRKARITVTVQENPRSVPMLLLELSIPTGKFMQDMGSGLLRIALESEKKPEKTRLLDEPVWTAFANGKKIGYGTKRDPTAKDLKIMQLLHATSMGAGVLPADMMDPVEGELTYMRGHFERVINSKDSETFYMLNPDGNSGPELSIFFVRI